LKSSRSRGSSLCHTSRTRTHRATHRRRRDPPLLVLSSSSTCGPKGVTPT